MVIAPHEPSRSVFVAPDRDDRVAPRSRRLAILVASTARQQQANRTASVLGREQRMERRPRWRQAVSSVGAAGGGAAGWAAANARVTPPCRQPGASERHSRAETAPRPRSEQYLAASALGNLIAAHKLVANASDGAGIACRS